MNGHVVSGKDVYMNQLHYSQDELSQGEPAGLLLVRVLVPVRGCSDKSAEASAETR